MRDYIKRNAILLAIGVSCAAWACGDDDDDDGGTGATGGTAGKGGSAGTAGKGGTGGTAGKGGTGGTAGKGGTGGTAGKGGTSGGGTGGGDAGAGAGGEDTGGDGGTDQGGSGGTSQGGAGAGNETGGAGGVAGSGDVGGQGGDDTAPGGAAGAGGAPAAATLTELCTTICGRVDAFASTASCRDENCLTLCAAQSSGVPSVDAMYYDMVSCITANLDASEDFACANTDTLGSKWSTVVSGTNACDTETCAWTCSGAYEVDPDLYEGACACEG